MATFLATGFTAFFLAIGFTTFLATGFATFLAIGFATFFLATGLTTFFATGFTAFLDAGLTTFFADLTTFFVATAAFFFTGTGLLLLADFTGVLALAAGLAFFLSLPILKNLDAKLTKSLITAIFVNEGVNIKNR